MPVKATLSKPSFTMSESSFSAALSEVVCEIYKLQVPKKENTITTYNVGNIEGGTSVNTIAQKASLLCEYRSNDRECLAVMKAEFERIFAAADTEETKLTVNLIGNRPCKGEVDPEAEAALIDAYRQAGGAPNLDYRHTVFGQVYDGLEIAFDISFVKTDDNDRPKEAVVIETIEISVIE